MIKFIVSDLDGTLLDSRQQLTKRTALAIQKLQKKGVRFLLNTEREYFDAKHLIKQAGIECDMICSGGACIVDQKGQNQRASYIPQDQIAPMLRLFGKHRTFYEIYSTKGRCILGTKKAYETYLTAEVIPSLLLQDKNFSLTQKAFDQRINETLFYDSANALLKENPKILKITTSSNDTWKLENLKREIQEQVHQLVVSDDSIYRLEITAIEALKGVALKEYMEDHSLSLKHTLVIGDGENDYSMLALPYIYSVAMENATPLIQNICEYQTKSNDENGAALVFENILHQHT